MRDAHRIKERYEVSLDNRQIVSVAISGLVVLGAVFGLGVVVGKKLSTDQTVAEAPDLLTALDAKAASLEALKQQTPDLTFHEELTARAPEARPSVPSEADAGERAEAPQEKPPRPPSEEVSKGTTEHVAVRTLEPARLALSEAIARTQIPVEARAGGAFTLQLAASQERAEAEQYISRLRDRGYAPYITEAEVAGRGRWYRVRMGSFPTKEAATRYLSDFRRETKLEGFITPNE